MKTKENAGILEKWFHLSESHTDVKTEVMAGITTFMTMAYILAVNPSVLSDAGMDSGAVFTATAFAACVSTLLMALFANYPFVLASARNIRDFKKSKVTAFSPTEFLSRLQQIKKCGLKFSQLNLL